MKTALTLLLLALALAAAPAWADERGCGCGRGNGHGHGHGDGHGRGGCGCGHERARAAREAGQVLPLPALLDRLQQAHPGQVMALELEQDEGRWVYKVKLLQPGGQLSKLKLDARTGEVFDIKIKDAASPPPAPASAAPPVP